ncbi:uncharacterized protein [Nicotiana sylvestris]|uniref:uncharacterized protein n=1 Tax=Nicotiana sylvestris TaxID=4096 RepID=UPI00388C5E1E
MNLVSTDFDRRSYGGWRRVVVIALSANNKLGFIDGTLTIPQVDSGLQKTWARCNDMVLSWILNSLSKEIGESVLYSQSAKDLWSDLENRFGQTNGAKLFQLQKQLSVVVKNSKAHQDERLLQFLMGESGSFLATNQQGNERRFNENKGQKGGFDPRKNAGICTCCKKTRHTIDKCYRIHGFPADFKFTKQRKFQRNVQANVVFNTNEKEIQ